MIHSTAIINKKAKLGENVQIGAYSIIGANVEILGGTWVGPHVVINGPCLIGENNKIYQFTSLGEDPQDSKYNGEPTILSIGNNNIIREFCTMNRGTERGGAKTQVGNNNLFMAYTHVAHDCYIGNNTILANAASLAGHVKVHDFAILGGFTCVHQFTNIGEYSFSGLGTVINRDVPPYSIVAGNHAKAYGINKNGLRRKKFSKDTIQKLHKAFKLLVKSKASKKSVEEEINKLSASSEEVAIYKEFIENSVRGVVR